MANSQVYQQFKEDLYISYSQVFVYLTCSLKYKFMYVEKRPHERIAVALPFGSAIHKSMERYYRSLKDNGSIEPLNVLEEIFEERVRLDLERTDVPVLYKKEASDQESLINMGKALLKAFYENVNLDGMEIVDVEFPLGANLYTDTGETTEFKLIGVIDLLLRNEDGELIVIDNKTAAKAKSQSAVDDDLQFTAYSYLLAANKYVFPTAPVHCRMDVLRKLKKPKLQYHETVRTSEDRKRFAKIANAVLAGIENRVFIPNKSWFCTDCQFIDACKAW
jgi:putative RecB family exonuclease